MSHIEPPQLTAQQQAQVDLWEAHTRAEFIDKDAAASCDTMIPDAYVNHVPTLAGGHGRRQLEHFYGHYFIPHMPPDTETELISRTVGHGQIVDELIFRCTHTTHIEWLLPGVPPTGRRLELVLVVIVAFENGKMHHEHILWDQASALVQLGLLDPTNLPVVGREAARKLQDPAAIPSNTLLKRHHPDPLL